MGHRRRGVLGPGGVGPGALGPGGGYPDLAVAGPRAGARRAGARGRCPPGAATVRRGRRRGRDAAGPVPGRADRAGRRRRGRLSDSELAGVLRASRRQVAREQYKQALAAAEFGRRRRAAFKDALARGVPAGCAAGGFPGEELAIELVITRGEAGHLIDDAIDLTARLPRTLAGMAAGLIDAGKAGWIALYTRSLNPADAARADEVLAGEAPELRAEQLARKAAALEMKLNPDAVRARRERAKRDSQRVEARREASGNASLAGRELDTADVLASKAYLDALAARLRASGLPGSLDRLRALALTDLTQGRDPLDRITPEPAPAPAQPRPPPAPARPRPPGLPGRPRAARPAPTATTPAPPSSGPPPAARARTVAGPRRPTRPGPDQPHHPGRDAARLVRRARPGRPWGLLDRDDTRAVATAAAAHPRTRWCATLTGPDGTALAHGCARGPRPRLLDTARTPATASPAHRAPAPPQHHLHPDRQELPRPRARRGRLRPKPHPQAPGPRPHRDVRRPRLPEPGRQRRPGPHPPVARRPDRPGQPRPELPHAPSRQASTGLDGGAARTRRHPLEAALRPHPHHHPHQVRHVVGRLVRGSPRRSTDSPLFEVTLCHDSAGAAGPAGAVRLTLRGERCQRVPVSVCASAGWARCVMAALLAAAALSAGAATRASAATHDVYVANVGDGSVSCDRSHDRRGLRRPSRSAHIPSGSRLRLTTPRPGSSTKAIATCR